MSVLISFKQSAFDEGLHNKPLGWGASEVYASGPACEEEQLHLLRRRFRIVQLQSLHFSWNCNRDSKCPSKAVLRAGAEVSAHPMWSSCL